MPIPIANLCRQVTPPAQCWLEPVWPIVDSGYLCMGANNSLSLQQSWHLPSSSRGRLLRILSARQLLPAFFPCPPSHSPRSPTSITFQQRDYIQKWGLKLNRHTNIAPRRQSFKTLILSSGVVPGHQPTCLPNNICVESTTTDRRERRW